MSDGAPLLEVRNLKKYYPLSQGLFKRKAGTVKAVDDVSFTIQPGETFGLVGESGCGKSTIAKSVIRAVEPTDGDVIFHLDQPRNLAKLNREELKVARRHIQLVFQDPFSSLNPRHRVRDIIGEPLKVNDVVGGQELEEQVGQLMSSVGLRPEYQVRYPHAFSGGQRQRIGIARALALNPKLVIADEPVSALDVSVQAQVINLLEDLQETFDLTYLFIAHDLSVVEHISDRVAVMYLGQIIEITTSERLYQNPLHPYTVALLSAVPTADPDDQRQRIPIEGDVPDPADAPSGCKFHVRCPYAQDKCKTEEPRLVEIEPGHRASCHFAGELTF